MLLPSLPRDNDGRYSVAVDSRLLGDKNLGISIGSVKVVGLDFLKSATIAEAICPQTLSNHLVWKKLQIDVEPVVGADLQGSKDQASVSLPVGSSEIDAAISLLLAVDTNALGSV